MESLVIDILALDPAHLVDDNDIRQALESINLIPLIINNDTRISGEDIVLPNTNLILELAEEIMDGQYIDY